MQQKLVYFFGGGKADGRGEMKDILGGKGANLAEMTNLEIPVPAGFTISTEVCTFYMDRGGTFPDGLAKEVADAIGRVEAVMGMKFGDPADPLLFSVRSGARASMPGMMDTVLNIGLNATTVPGAHREDRRRALRLRQLPPAHQMYADVVMGLDIKEFHKLLAARKKEKRARHDVDLDAGGPQGPRRPSTRRRSARSPGATSRTIPKEQLWGAISAVFESWNTPRAVSYRRLYDIPDDWGTAVNVQAMVFGNMGDGCATGVAFTRDPATGERVFYGEYLPNAQGEDVVSGVRTPHPINRAQKKPGDAPSLEETMPDIYQRARLDPREARAPLHGHAGHRVHHPARQALDAPDADRASARRRRRCGSRSRWSRRA